MPSNAPEVKRRAVMGYGGRVILCEPTLEARETTANQVIAETGATLIHPYDHVDIIAGQGTAALELLNEVGELDVVITPVGGGGLLSGTCLACRGFDSNVQIFAAEPKGADDAARSLAQGRLTPQTGPDTIADGLLTSLGELTWPIIEQHASQIFTVSDAEIIDAMRFIWERAKIVIEPSAAVTIAALMSGQFQQMELSKVGVVISGGNVNLDVLPWQ